MKPACGASLSTEVLGRRTFESNELARIHVIAVVVNMLYVGVCVGCIPEGVVLFATTSTTVSVPASV